MGSGHGKMIDPRRNFTYKRPFTREGNYLVYIISPLTSQLWTASRKVSIKYIGPLAVYKIVDLLNYLLITLDGKLLRGLFEHDRLKPAVIRTNQGNVTNLSKLKQVMSSGLLVPWWAWWEKDQLHLIMKDVISM